MPTVHKPIHYTVPEAAKWLKVDRATVRQWIAAGKLPAVRVGPRSFRIKKEDVAAIIIARAKEALTDEERAKLFPVVSEEEIARRKALAEKILAHRKERSIAPLTSAELVREARKYEMRDHDPRR